MDETTDVSSFSQYIAFLQYADILGKIDVKFFGHSKIDFSRSNRC